MLKKLHIGCITLLISTSTFATVGGGQNIEILGYDKKDQKVYVLRDFEDARGRVPQLYFFDLKSTQPQQLIEVKSIYINPQTQQVDYDARWDEVMSSIDNIRKRLIPLPPMSDARFSLHVQQKVSTVPAWYDENETMQKYQYTYTVSTPTLASATQYATSYKPDLTLQHLYKIPQHNKSIVKVKYLGFPEETGYYNEEVFMLLPSP